MQSGKTFLGSVWVQKKLEQTKGKTGLIAAPTVKLLQQSTLEKYFQFVPEHRKFYKKQEGVIELPDKTKIFIRSTDEPLGLEGMTLHWAWLDEAGMMAKLVWTVIRSRVSITGGQVLMTTTPYNMGWLYQDVYLPWRQKKDEAIEVFTWKSIENPFFPKDYATQERLRLRPEEYARRYEGEFTKMQGLVWEFPEDQVFDPENKIVLQLLRYPERVIGGIDWGFHNPTGILVIKVKDARFYVVDEWKESGKTTAEIVNQVKEFARKHEVVIWYPDPAEPDRIEELRRGSLRIGETNKDVPVGLSHVESLIREKKLFISNRCEQLLDEMTQYHFEEGTDGKPLKELPVKMNDHLCDSLRYACMGYRPTDPRIIKVREMSLAEQRKTRQYGFE